MKIDKIIIGVIKSLIVTTVLIFVVLWLMQCRMEYVHAHISIGDTVQSVMSDMGLPREKVFRGEVGPYGGIPNPHVSVRCYYYNDWLPYGGVYVLTVDVGGEGTVLGTGVLVSP